MIPQIDVSVLFDRDNPNREAVLEELRNAATDVGFLTLKNTAIPAADVIHLINTYRAFFRGPLAVKHAVDMSATGSNRGWGAPHAEQVNPDSNPDYKEVFDAGTTLDANDPLREHTYYAPNRWPTAPIHFQATVKRYFQHSTALALDLLSAIAEAIDLPADYFTDKFDKPMTLLRGNYYPPRPDYAGVRDFGIAPHTDYGCLTLLAMDGEPGLEVRHRDGHWLPVNVEPGAFVVNFGEMLERWSNGKIVATPHRVVGTDQERLSVPLFFNPRLDVNVAPYGSDEVLLAGEWLGRRYDETYVHRQKNSPKSM